MDTTSQTQGVDTETHHPNNAPTGFPSGTATKATEHAVGHSLGEHRGHGAAHDLLAWVFFAGRRRAVYRRVVVLSGAQPGDQVLDVGCGDGYLTRLMAEAVGLSGTTVGIDPSAEAITAARRRTNLRNCSFAPWTAQAIEAADGTYDVVVSSLMLHHLPEVDRPAAVAQMARVLRPGGALLIAEFRPPRTGIVRRVVSPVASPSMQTNPLHLLPPLLADSGLDEVQAFDLRPWIHAVRGRKR